MKMQRHNRSSQTGIVMILMTIGMVVLVGVSGLALDMGHTYLMKTRLQNALDAAALSGAKTLQNGEGKDQAAIDAKNTFDINAVGDMNETGLTPVVEFADTYFNPGSTLDPKYIRVSLKDYVEPQFVKPATTRRRI